VIPAGQSGTLDGARMAQSTHDASPRGPRHTVMARSRMLTGAAAGMRRAHDVSGRHTRGDAGAGVPGGARG